MDDLSARLLEKIKIKIEEISRILRELGYDLKSISEKEFYYYLTGETPYQEAYKLNDVLENEFLMLHEVVEISELKKMGIPINRSTVMDFHTKVYEAHLTATDIELSYALKKRDFSWIKTRLEHAKQWINDEYLPPSLVPKVNELIRKYGSSL